jgi:hypothetical protein
LKVARIGTSRGVRLQAATLDRHHIAGKVVMEEPADGILLRPLGRADQKPSWEDTAREMGSAAKRQIHEQSSSVSMPSTRASIPSSFVHSRLDCTPAKAGALRRLIADYVRRISRNESNGEELSDGFL